MQSTAGLHASLRAKAASADHRHCPGWRAEELQDLGILACRWWCLMATRTATTWVSTRLNTRPWLDCHWFVPCFAPSSQAYESNSARCVHKSTRIPACPVGSMSSGLTLSALNSATCGQLSGRSPLNREAPFEESSQGRLMDFDGFQRLATSNTPISTIWWVRTLSVDCIDSLTPSPPLQNLSYHIQSR